MLIKKKRYRVGNRQSENDIGIIVDHKLNVSQHHGNKFKKAKENLGCINKQISK